jgi:hypothetical protein
MKERSYTATYTKRLVRRSRALEVAITGSGLVEVVLVRLSKGRQKQKKRELRL